MASTKSRTDTETTRRRFLEGLRRTVETGQGSSNQLKTYSDPKAMYDWTVTHGNTGNDKSICHNRRNIQDEREYSSAAVSKQIALKKEMNRIRNLSTPKYYTRLNNRETSLLPTPVPAAEKIRCKSLNTPRLAIPHFRVSTTELPELRGSCAISERTTLVDHQHLHRYRQTQSEPNGDSGKWLSLIQRNVSERPRFAEPIHCKPSNPKSTTIEHLETERMKVPVRSFFQGVTRRGGQREFAVHPEFVSEHRRLSYIAGQSSNPLKYGWLG